MKRVSDQVDPNSYLCKHLFSNVGYQSRHINVLKLLLLLVVVQSSRVETHLCLPRAHIFSKGHHHAATTLVMEKASSTSTRSSLPKLISALRSHTGNKEKTFFRHNVSGSSLQLFQIQPYTCLSNILENQVRRLHIDYLPSKICFSIPTPSFTLRYLSRRSCTCFLAI